MAKIISVVFLALGVIGLADGVGAQETGKKVIATPTAPMRSGRIPKQFERVRRFILQDKSRLTQRQIS